MNSTPKISFNWFFILLLVCLHWSCQTHYAYRPKVRVKQAKQLVLKKEKLDVNKRVDSLIDQASNDIVASADTTINHQYYYIEKSTLRVDSEFVQNKINNLKPPKSRPKSLQKPPTTAPINYQAKWSFVLALLSLLFFPAVIGPTSIILGFKALREIKMKRQRGVTWAIFGILLGLASTSAAILLLVLSLLYNPALDAYIFFYFTLLVLIFIQNLVVNYMIERSPKNPSFKQYREDPKTEIKNGMRIFILSLITLLLLLHIVIILV